jgi:hypothetical protein
MQQPYTWIQNNVLLMMFSFWFKSQSLDRFVASVDYLFQRQEKQDYERKHAYDSHSFRHCVMAVNLNLCLSSYASTAKHMKDYWCSDFRKESCARWILCRFIIVRILQSASIWA